MERSLKEGKLRECLFRAFSLFCSENPEFLMVRVGSIGFSGDLRRATIVAIFPSKEDMVLNLPKMHDKIYDITIILKKLVSTRFFPKIIIEGTYLED